jgi:hypothetical protein
MATYLQGIGSELVASRSAAYPERELVSAEREVVGSASRHDGWVFGEALRALGEVEKVNHSSETCCGNCVRAFVLLTAGRLG